MKLEYGLSSKTAFILTMLDPRYLQKSWQAVWQTFIAIRHAPQQRQQIVNLRLGASFRSQSNNNKSFILALEHHLSPKHRQYIVHFDIRASYRDQSNDKKFYNFVRWGSQINGSKSQHRSTNSKPKQQQQIVYICIRHYSTSIRLNEPRQNEALYLDAFYFSMNLYSRPSSMRAKS